MNFISAPMTTCTFEQFAALIAAEMAEGWRCVGPTRLINGCWFQEFSKAKVKEGEAFSV